MGATKPFTKRERHRLTGGALGFRPLCDWGDGDLPAPFAVGDVLSLPKPSHLDRLTNRGMGHAGWYVVCDAWSIDEGDAWYFRVVTDSSPDRSDRLHWASSARSTWPEDVDYLAEFEWVDTADPEGLVERERLLADGWTLTRNPDPEDAENERLRVALAEERALTDLLAADMREIANTDWVDNCLDPQRPARMVRAALAVYEKSRGVSDAG